MPGAVLSPKPLGPPRVASDTGPPGAPQGTLTAVELAERVRWPTRALGADALEAWLLEQRLATSRAGRLELTPHGLEVADAIG